MRPCFRWSTNRVMRVHGERRVAWLRPLFLSRFSRLISHTIMQSPCVHSSPIPHMLSRPMALLGNNGPFEPTASGYSGEIGPKKRARRCCAECGWPQSGFGHELDGGRQVGGKRDHASMAGRRTMAWGPCPVAVSDWNPDMPRKKRAKALLTRAARESGKALL